MGTRKITEELWDKAAERLLHEIIYSWSDCENGPLVIPKKHPWGFFLAKALSSMGKGAMETFHWYTRDPVLYVKYFPRKAARIQAAFEAAMPYARMEVKTDRYKNNKCRFCGGPAYPCLIRHNEGKSCA